MMKDNDLEFTTRTISWHHIHPGGGPSIPSYDSLLRFIAEMNEEGWEPCSDPYTNPVMFKRKRKQ